MHICRPTVYSKSPCKGAYVSCYQSVIANFVYQILKKNDFPSRICIFYLPIPNDSCEGPRWRISSAFFMYSKSFRLSAAWHVLIRSSLRPRNDSPGEKSWHVYSSSVFPESQGHQVCCKGVQVLYFLSQPKWHNEKGSEMPWAQF